MFHSGSFEELTAHSVTPGRAEEESLSTFCVCVHTHTHMMLNAPQEPEQKEVLHSQHRYTQANRATNCTPLLSCILLSYN